MNGRTPNRLLELHGAKRRPAPSIANQPVPIVPMPTGAIMAASVLLLLASLALGLLGERSEGRNAYDD